jgi:hypothetical protein
MVGIVAYVPLPIELSYLYITVPAVRTR